MPLQPQDYQKLCDILNYSFHDMRLLECALNSALARKQVKQKNSANNNQALATLGDGLLRAIIEDILLEIDTHCSKGILSQVRDKLVNNKAQAQIAKRMGLDHFVNISKNAESSKKILADCLEAIIGAIFLDSKRNYLATKRFVIQQWLLQDYYIEYLAEAIQSQDAEQVSYLLDCGTNVNAILTIDDSIPSTPLLIATTPDIVEILLKRGADVNQCCPLGMTALYNAACLGNIEVAKVLRRYGAEFIGCYFDNYSPLHVAVFYKRLEMAEFLLQEGLLVNRSDTNGQTALHVAASRDLPEIAECLLTYGANVNEMPVRTGLYNDNEFKAPLPPEIAEGKPSEIALFLKHQPNVNGPKTYKSPLHVAAAHNRIKIIKVLSTHQANLNIQNHDGQTPLHCASANGHYVVVKQLIQYGADIEILDKNGYKAIDLSKDDNIRKLLTQASNSKKKTLLQTSPQRFFSLFKVYHPLTIAHPQKGHTEFENDNHTEGNSTGRQYVGCVIL